MRFLIDAQLPPALASWIAAQGHQADHVATFDLAGAADPEIWALACKLDTVLLTKDEDFVLIQQQAGSGPAVVWLRLGNATNRRLIEWLAARWPKMIAALELGETVIEVR